MTTITGRFQSIDTNMLIERALRVAGPTAAIRRLTGKSGAEIVQIRTGDTVALADGTTANPMIWMRNANDGAHALLVHSGVFRIVCNNGLVIGDGYAQRVIHVAGPKLTGFLDQFDDAVAGGLEYAYEVEPLSQELMQCKVSEAQAIDIIGNLNLTNGVKEAAIRCVVLGDRRPQDSTDRLWGVYQLINELNRVRSRSQLAAGYREFQLLDDIRALYDAQQRRPQLQLAAA